MDSIGDRAGADPRRRVLLERASNFRDLGGYAVPGGQRTRWARAYRAGELVQITDADVARLQSLGLRLIFDLRTSSERDNRPPRLWDDGPRRLSRDYQHSGADLPSIVARTDIGADQLRRNMVALYRALPFDQADAFRTLLQEAAAGETPLLFHCAGGKDRTGVFAALLLDLLGVSRTDILADYMLSNNNIDAARTRFLNHIGRDDVDPAIWDPLLMVDETYLTSMFDALDERLGGMEAYVRWLGISQDEVAAIRCHLLEPEDEHA
jgi:protein-tyrosine phosphatase